MKDKNFKFYIKVVEALLFSSSEPVKDHVITSKLPDTIDTNEVMKEISEFYKDRGIECLRINDSWAFRTSKDVSDYLDVERVVTKPLSRPALETLSIIAYHQPVTRSEIEAIRGVGVARGTIDILLELEWIKPKGRKRSPGRPLTWGTTDKFLDIFGLEDISNLPGMSELKAAGLVGSRPIISDDLSNVVEKDIEKDLES